MSKRLASHNASPKRRKQNRNGILVTKEVLGPPEATSLMRVWHANAEEPTTTRKSNALIPDPQDPPPVERAVQFEELLDVGGVPHSVAPHSKRKRPKRKRRNDSVSPFLLSENFTYS